MKFGLQSLLAASLPVCIVLAGCGSGNGGSTTTTTPTPAEQAASAPVFSVAAGTYTGTQTVTLSSTTTGATIFYTTDGSTPSTSSTVYTAPVSVNTSETVQAFATASGFTPSSVGKAAYSINSKISMLLSDDPTEDWATIGVKVLSISLVPQGNGTPVNIYTPPATPPVVNLVQLDQLDEIIGNAVIPTGTYTQAVLTLGANNTGTACDVLLVASGDPESGFDVPAGTTVPCSQIVIAGAQGTTPNLTVPLTINLASPAVVTGSSTNALDLDFNLRNPALIVEHEPVGATSPTWVVNFNGPVRHHPRADLSRLDLRHLYGQAGAVSADNTSVAVTRVIPVRPLTSPETATTDSTAAISILADAANGTLFYDLDNTTSSAPVTVKDFSTLGSTLPNLYLRVAARYQQNGTLVATRIYASKTFDTVWKNPEGHVLHVNTTNNVMDVTTEDGNATRVAIGPDTAFYFGSSNAVIGTGTAFFDGVTPGKLPNVARGFKVAVTTDPLSTAKPPVALTVEVEMARYNGAITLPTATGFDLARNFADADGRGGLDNYTGTLDYIASASANTDQEGTAISGFYWWNFGFPTLEDEGANAVSDFEAAADGSVNFGGSVGALVPQGLSASNWNDSAAPDAWAARWALLTPVEAPLGTVTTAFATPSDSFTYAVPLPSAAPKSTPAATPVTVELDTTSGSATLVYDVDRQANVITVTPEDISNSTTLTAVGNALVANTPVKVYGVPQKDGSIKAYTLFYYTHTASTK
jgi:hypothetical protein